MTTIRKTSAATANSQLESARGRARETDDTEAVDCAWEAMIRDMATSAPLANRNFSLDVML
jgi:hypothetical protein